MGWLDRTRPNNVKLICKAVAIVLCVWWVLLPLIGQFQTLGEALTQSATSVEEYKIKLGQALQEIERLQRELKARQNFNTTSTGPSFEHVLRIDSSNRIGENYTLFGGQHAARLGFENRTTVVFIVIITSQGDRAAKQRNLVRTTWLDQIQTEIPHSQVMARFFIGHYNNTTAVTANVAAEMESHQDIVVVDVGDSYGGLIEKVRASFQWVVSHHEAQFVAKFDDDCYVAPLNLLAALSKQPHERLYFGKMMHGSRVQRDQGRNSEPHLPKEVDWFPPYASGAGYVLSWDLVKTVAFPGVKLLPMINEDGHLGFVLLPFDVHRVTTAHIHAYGVQTNCLNANEVIAIHYVKDEADHDCMHEIHHNISHGLQVCESRFCGPINCDFKFPWPHKRSRKTKCNRKLAFEEISGTQSCEINNDQGVKRYFVAPRMRDLKCCQQLCLQLCDCVAVDYYRVTAWCNLYTKACTTPQKATEGASSYQLVL
eukprot:m.269259 g.269259  ORF g.269259 m.269259 type:complete len:483 (+) comp83272_c0_seq1:143-1591(+)